MKRCISLLLVLVMVFSMIPVSSSAVGTQPSTGVKTDDVTIEGTNGFVNLLSEAIIREQEKQEEDYEPGYSISILENETLEDYGSIVASGKCGAEGENAQWTLFESGLLRITGYGAVSNPFSSWGSDKWNSSDILSVEIADGINKIDCDLFNSCDNLTSAKIGNGIKIIPERTFAWCSNLTDM